MHNERVVRRSALGIENAINCLGRKCIGSQPIDGLSRYGDKLPLTQQLHRSVKCFSINARLYFAVDLIIAGFAQVWYSARIPTVCGLRFGSSVVQ